MNTAPATSRFATTPDRHLPHRVAMAAALAVLGALDAFLTWFVPTRPGQPVAEEGNPILLALSGGNITAMVAIIIGVTWTLAAIILAVRRINGAMLTDRVFRYAPLAIVTVLIAPRAYMVLNNVGCLLVWIRTTR